MGCYSFLGSYGIIIISAWGSEELLVLFPMGNSYGLDTWSEWLVIVSTSFLSYKTAAVNGKATPNFTIYNRNLSCYGDLQDAL